MLAENESILDVLNSVLNNERGEIMLRSQELYNNILMMVKSKSDQWRAWSKQDIYQHGYLEQEKEKHIDVVVDAGIQLADKKLKEIAIEKEKLDKKYKQPDPDIAKMERLKLQLKLKSNQELLDELIVNAESGNEYRDEYLIACEIIANRPVQNAIDLTMYMTYAKHYNIDQPALNNEQYTDILKDIPMIKKMREGLEQRMLSDGLRHGIGLRSILEDGIRG